MYDLTSDVFSMERIYSQKGLFYKVHSFNTNNREI